MIDATVADTVDEVIQLIYGIMCSHNQEVLRKLDNIEIISDEEDDVYPILDPIMMSAQIPEPTPDVDITMIESQTSLPPIGNPQPTNPTTVNGNDNQTPLQAEKGPPFALGTLHFNRITFEQYVASLKCSSTLLLSERDERWALSDQCARDASCVSVEERPIVARLLKAYANAFHRPGDKLSATWVTEHCIPLTDESKSVYIRTRATGHTETGIVLDLTQKQVHAGVVEPCPVPSSFNSPHIPVPKKQKGRYRLIGQFVQLNKASNHIPMFPMSRIDDSLHLCKGMKIFSTSDFKDGYFQIPIKPSDRHKTAYRIHNHGQYQYIRMAQGLAGAPATFNFAVNQVLGWTKLLHVDDQLVSVCVFFVDDIMIASTGFNEHLAHWGIVLEALERAHLVLNMAKTSVFQKLVTFCGRSIDHLGIGPTPDDLQRLRAWRMPDTTKRLNEFLGFVNYLNSFIPKCAIYCQTMRAAGTSGHRIKITDKYVEAFLAIQASITDDMRLALPIWDNPSYPFYLTSDASDKGCAVVLLQKSPDSGDDKRVISFTSKPFVKLEDTSLPIPAKEAYAIAYGLQHFRRWLLGQPLIIETDHLSIAKTFTKADANNPRFIRWLLIIQEYSPIAVKHILGKSNCFADALSRNPAFNEQYARLNTVEQDFADRVYLVNDVNGDTSPSAFQPLQSCSKLPELLGASMRASQLRDDSLLRIIHVLEGTTVSKDPDLLKHVKSFEMIDGRLFKRCLPLPKLAVPRDLRESIITMYHDELMGGHRGIVYTQARIELQFWWPKLADDVELYVKNCSVCNTTKVGRRLHVPSGSLSKDVPYPFHTINMDVLGPLPTTTSKNTYIISFVCVLSRWAEAYATSNHTATTVADCLISLVTRHGFPKVIVSDRGPEFGAHVFEDMMKRLGIELKPHEPYAHWRSGSVERFHGTLLSIIRSYTDRYPNQWDTHLPLALYAYRTCIQQRLGCSPFKLLYGREPTTLLQTVLDLPDSPYPEVRPLVSWLHQATVLANQTDGVAARNNRPIDTIGIGDLVYKIVHKPESKLEPRLLGRTKPYLIVDRKDTMVTYLDHNQKQATGHVSNFKLAKLTHPQSAGSIIAKPLSDREQAGPPINSTQDDINMSTNHPNSGNLNGVSDEQHSALTNYRKSMEHIESVGDSTMTDDPQCSLTQPVSNGGIVTKNVSSVDSATQLSNNIVPPSTGPTSLGEGGSTSSTAGSLLGTSTKTSRTRPYRRPVNKPRA